MILAAGALEADDLDIGAVHQARRDEAIDIAVHPIRFPHINVPDPATPLAAKFSVHYCVARALTTGRVVIDDFEDGAAFADATTRRLMQRTALSKYERDNPSGAEVSIRTRDGRQFSTYVEAALGSTYDHWMSDDMVRAKFLDCAARALDPETGERLYTHLGELDRCRDIRDLTMIAANRARSVSPVAAE
jgi:2-methylcitrate dehydratase PrpD